MRTCIGCRTPGARSGMLRFVRAPDGTVAFDVRGKLPGRGAWTLPNESCVRRGATKGGFARTFEQPVLVDVEELVKRVSGTLNEVALQALGLCHKSQQLVAGRTESLKAVLAQPQGYWLLLASDLAPRSKEDMEAKAEGIKILSTFSKDEIGIALGRRATGVVAVRTSPMGKKLRSDAVRAARFLGHSVPQNLLPKWRVAAENEEEGQTASCGDDDSGVQAPITREIALKGDHPES
ncbi:MAG: DUF448 domain-containing protein [Deltaproteobacteria bacterium]|nr:DUF448 domain-containing protein [Deltaproteobacteria bacterium]